MGREVRLVPPNWEHPKVERYGRKEYQPMHDMNYSDAIAEWKADPFEVGEDSKSDPSHDQCEYLEDIGNLPNPEDYRPWKKEDATWFQVWETVSPGTPVTPPFENQEQLIEYLATKGDFWDQRSGEGPWEREIAEQFVKAGWTPSMRVEK